MGVFFGIISTLVTLICAVWLLVNLLLRKGKKGPLIGLCAGFVLFAAAIAISPESDIVEEPAAEPPAAEQLAPDPPATVTQPAEKQPGEPEATAPLSPVTLTKATVIRVIDGDTIEVRLEDGSEERVRMIGVDTPESTTRLEPFGREASNFTKSELSGKTIYLEKDVTDRDRFDRLLRYVWLEIPTISSGQEIQVKMFNAILLLKGYAQVATFPPNVKYVDYFTEYQAKARESGAGLWGNGAAEPELETEAMFVGSADSNKYHHPGCRWAERISPANLIKFGSVQEARNAGYVPCGVCSPP
jgi:micrococcal nuclease